MKNINTILIAIIVLLVGGFIFYNNLKKEKTTINVNGESKIDALADRVTVYIGIETLKENTEESKNENSEISDRILYALYKEGISKSEIETSSYNIYPDYSYEDGKQILKGYKTSNLLKIKTKDFDKIGKIVDASIDAGATNVQSINFELSQEKQNEIKTQAIGKATEDARLKAEATAKGLNAKIGRVKTVNIQDYNYYPYPLYTLESGADVRKAVSTEILPSNLEVRALVNVVFEIQ